MSSLYILDIRPLSEVSLANMFSYTGCSLFILLIYSLAVQKFYFDEVPLVYSFLYVPCSRGNIVENIADGIPEISVPMFSSRTFMVS